jgi:uncharacterized membrane protein
MSVLCLLGSYLVLHAANVLETEVRAVLVATAVLTGVSIGVGYYARFQKRGSTAGGMSQYQRKGIGAVIRAYAMMSIPLFATLLGVYLVLQRHWELGVGVILLSSLYPFFFSNKWSTPQGNRGG